MDNPTHLYLDLLKRTLTNTVYQDSSNPRLPAGPGAAPHGPYNAELRSRGEDWPTVAHTMVGLKRLQNVQDCVERVIADGIPGDLIETGVWRGGVCIFMRGILKVHGVDDRAVWVADSFQGMPEVGEDSKPRDRKMRMHEYNDVLGIPMEQVQENFRRYGLLDEAVKFLPGWFKDTMPEAPVERIAVLRLDGDLYESTTAVLENLYPKLSVGGYAIIDDYGLRACADAVHDYRDANGITDEIVTVDKFGVYWRRSA
ncbi:macrocin-O-methyltransferase [Actinokineospora spheciospongiae]|uniref:Macrocin-O-methyltransferase n=1 Tax=Actinokineospora spheciospongiae TaxID=909613 RepID=W7J321_9PSEU|nr:TylF/MycF family methyltransferase [Actinokineospora spheciospongiae]EWC63336.1 macrocin-O-methyltransferase [Actinokineospora spheciospongiae]